MSGSVLVLRPQPGADETAARARIMGLAATVAPLFAIRPLRWTMPDEPVDAVMLTSANGARCGGDGLTPCLGRPCYAVGDATARAAREAGFADIRTGPADGAALLAQMLGDGIAAALHPCGADHIALSDPHVRIIDLPVYVAEPAGALSPSAAAALNHGALALLHSPRAAALFATLVGPERACIRLAAISEATARAAGDGWASVEVASRPRDEALLELAVKLCQSDRA